MIESSPGVISKQTLAGAIATGTHGQGLSQSSLAESVYSFKVILADGSTIVINQGYEWFDAFKLGLGSLGIMTEITLKTKPERIFTCRKKVVSADNLADFVFNTSKEYELTKYWWFPEDNYTQAWLVQASTKEEENLYQYSGRNVAEISKANDSFDNEINKTIGYLKQDTFDDKAIADRFKTLERFKSFKDIVGNIYQIFCKGIPANQVNVEISIPLYMLGEAVDMIKLWHKIKKPHIHYPIILRPTGPSSSWLSPAYRQEVCYIGFVVYYSDDGRISKEGLDFLMDMQKILSAIGGRPHWGKYFDKDLYDLPQLYPKWEEFCKLRKTLDPKNIFPNDFTHSLFVGGRDMVTINEDR